MPPQRFPCGPGKTPLVFACSLWERTIPERWIFSNGTLAHRAGEKYEEEGIARRNCYPSCPVLVLESVLSISWGLRYPGASPGNTSPQSRGCNQGDFSMPPSGLSCTGFSHCWDVPKLSSQPSPRDLAQPPALRAGRKEQRGEVGAAEQVVWPMFLTAKGKMPFSSLMSSLS